MCLRKTMASLTLAGALAAAPTLALGQAQYLGPEAPPGRAAAEGAGFATADSATAAAVAAGLAVAAAVAEAVAAARGGKRTGTPASQ
ncbi:MAG: hypothetical protein J4F40_04550 [Alphaproteobacteria bacterium]|nr:hypothetical protein [Alphaproteobacteria bacterium]